tara:strand:- start:194 stop:646 length:453 start_codon:yes stop_codon:yes gene_type:complete
MKDVINMSTRQTKLDEHGIKTSKSRQTRLTEFGIVLLFLCSSLAGCTDMIPDPPSEYDSVSGSFDTFDNKTIPVVAIGNNTTFLEIISINYNITNSNNDWLDINGYAFQEENDFIFNYGYALDIGKVYLHFAYVENASYTYEVFYTERIV